MNESGFDLNIKNIARKAGNLFGINRKKIITIPNQPQEVSPSKSDAPDLSTKKEAASREKNLGRLFQTRIASLPVENLPPIFEESMGVSGLLATNEDLNDSLIEQTRLAGNPPDGYIFGAGFGNILTTTLLYPKNQLPRAILAVDVLPEVVLTGRIFTSLLAETKDFSTLQSGLKDKSVLRQQYNRVLEGEQNITVKERFKKTSFEKVKDEIKSVLSREYLPGEGIKQSAFAGKERVSVIAVIRDNFDALQQLAKEGNIGVAYADMINPQVLDVVKTMPDFNHLRNIIYMSNVIDHLTQRGTDLAHINDMDTLKNLGEGKSWFIDTTQKSQDYQLRAGHFVPKYRQSDLIW